MSANAFEKTNWGWQQQQLERQVGEWFELTFASSAERLSRTVPDWPWLPGLLRGAFWVTVALLAILVAWLLYKLVLRLRPYLASLRAQSQSLSPAPAAPALEQSVAGWLAQVQAFGQQGNYREACRALYRAMLRHLNDRQLIADRPDLTDGEYRQLIQRLPQPESYNLLLTTHEQLCFDNAAISAERFERCQQAYRAIERGSGPSREA